jgi:hypothetical protein
MYRGVVLARLGLAIDRHVEHGPGVEGMHAEVLVRAHELVQTAGELRAGQAGDLETAGSLLLDGEGQGGDSSQRAQAQPQRAQVALVAGLDGAAIGEDHGGAAHQLGHDAALAAIAVCPWPGPGQGLLSKLPQKRSA